MHIPIGRQTFHCLFINKNEPNNPVRLIGIKNIADIAILKLESVKTNIINQFILFSLSITMRAKKYTRQGNIIFPKIPFPSDNR